MGEPLITRLRLLDALRMGGWRVVRGGGAIEEAARDVGCGEFAAWFVGEESLAPAGEGVVRGVAPRAGDDREDEERGPWEAEAASDAERGGGAGVEALSVEEDQGIGERRWRVGAREEVTGYGGLERGEAEAFFGVSPDDELDGSGAEGAVAIEEDDGMGRVGVARGVGHRISRGGGVDARRVGVAADGSGFRMGMGSS